MLRFILRKIGLIIPTFLGITLLSFILVHLIPGDPVAIMAGERGLDPVRHAQMMEQLGLNQSLVMQYFNYLGSIFHGDLGKSIVTNTPVIKEFSTLFPATIELSVLAIMFAILIGIPLGIVAAIKRGSIWDHGVMGISLTGYSMPIFWWALLLILLFSVQLGITPVSGRIDSGFWIDEVTGFMLIDTLLAGDMPAFWSALHHLILPAIVLGTIPLAVIARMTRSSMLEVLGEDYIRAARGKGVSPWRVIFVHALRNALIPVVTVIGLQVGVLMAGAILTETIFSWPGIGKWLIESVQRRDYPVVQGGILLIATMIILINFIVDITYGFINPRIRNQH